MSKTNAPTIVGAGLAGLIAAHAWPTARILEASPEPRESHRALLRFRTDAVARLTGTEFRPVQVRKGIWSEGRYVPADIRVANLYARKVIGRVAGERSIWNLDPVERFIAPDDFYERLVDQCGPRIHWDHKADFEGYSAHRTERGSGPMISTAPLPLTLAALGVEVQDTGALFERAPITVERWRVPGADLFQTVYFPDEDTSLYRASITGDVMILEYAGDPGESWSVHDLNLAARAFGLSDDALEMEERVGQRYGKISPIPDALRKQLLFRLTHHYNIYSLGRFATWRNILLDDVVKDIDVIKRLMNTASDYELRHAAT